MPFEETCSQLRLHIGVKLSSSAFQRTRLSAPTLTTVDGRHDTVLLCVSYLQTARPDGRSVAPSRSETGGSPSPCPCAAAQRSHGAVRLHSEWGFGSHRRRRPRGGGPGRHGLLVATAHDVERRLDELAVHRERPMEMCGSMGGGAVAMSPQCGQNLLPRRLGRFGYLNN